jgi:hypothetical protein
MDFGIKQNSSWPAYYNGNSIKRFFSIADSLSDSSGSGGHAGDDFLECRADNIKGSNVRSAFQ